MPDEQHGHLSLRGKSKTVALCKKRNLGIKVLNCSSLYTWVSYLLRRKRKKRKSNTIAAKGPGSLGLQAPSALGIVDNRGVKQLGGH